LGGLTSGHAVSGSVLPSPHRIKRPRPGYGGRVGNPKMCALISRSMALNAIK
jgi:hypothetical protein